MRVSANNTYKNGGISSYRLVIGCDQAKAFGLVDDEGNGLQIIPIKTQNGTLLIPATKPRYTLEYKGLQTTVFDCGAIFCGEISSGRKYATWLAKESGKVESAFHSAADKLLAE